MSIRALASVVPKKKKKCYFHISKSYFIYFNTLLYNTSYTRSSILRFQLLVRLDPCILRLFNLIN